LNLARKFGVDLSEKQVRLAEVKNLEARFFVKSGEDLDMPGRTFDYIIVSETINLAGVRSRYSRPGLYETGNGVDTAIRAINELGKPESKCKVARRFRNGLNSAGGNFF
jgi:hypothetical protein